MLGEYCGRQGEGTVRTGSHGTAKPDAVLAKVRELLGEWERG